MSAIHDLIRQIGDPRLRERLAAEWRAAIQRKAMAAEMREVAGPPHPGLHVVQRYRDYRDHFMINPGGAP